MKGELQWYIPLAIAGGCYLSCVLMDYVERRIDYRRGRSEEKPRLFNSIKLKSLWDDPI
jgi:hypothetical protein